MMSLSRRSRQQKRQPITACSQDSFSSSDCSSPADSSRTRMETTAAALNVRCTESLSSQTTEQSFEVEVLGEIVGAHGDTYVIVTAGAKSTDRSPMKSTANAVQTAAVSYNSRSTEADLTDDVLDLSRVKSEQHEGFVELGLSSSSVSQQQSLQLLEKLPSDETAAVALKQSPPSIGSQFAAASSSTAPPSSVADQCCKQTPDKLKLLSEQLCSLNADSAYLSTHIYSSRRQTPTRNRMRANKRQSLSTPRKPPVLLSPPVTGLPHASPRTTPRKSNLQQGGKTPLTVKFAFATPSSPSKIGLSTPSKKTPSKPHLKTPPQVRGQSSCKKSTGKKTKKTLPLTFPTPDKKQTKRKLYSESPEDGSEAPVSCSKPKKPCLRQSSRATNVSAVQDEAGVARCSSEEKSAITCSPSVLGESKQEVKQLYSDPSTLAPLLASSDRSVLPAAENLNADGGDVGGGGNVVPIDRAADTADGTTVSTDANIDAKDKAITDIAIYDVSTKRTAESVDGRRTNDDVSVADEVADDVRNSSVLLSPRRLEIDTSNGLPAISADIDASLEEKSEKINLTAGNVRSIIYQLITNEHVQDMVRNTLMQQDGSVRAQLKEAIFEPKMTRSKLKQVIGSGGVSLSTPWALSPLKTTVKNEPSFLEMSFPDDDEDEEYCPNPEELELGGSDDESVLSSHASDYGSPRPSSSTPVPRCRSESASEANTSINSETTSVEPISMGPPAALPPVALPLRRKLLSTIHELSLIDNDKEVDNIALRTRSKLPLNDTPIDVIESNFFAPDITSDLYEDSSLVCDDDDWMSFLASLYRSQDHSDGDALSDDEADDPEYNVMEDTEDIDEEEVRNDKATRISKKEVNELWRQFFDEFEQDVPGWFDSDAKPVANSSELQQSEVTRPPPTPNPQSMPVFEPCDEGVESVHESPRPNASPKEVVDDRAAGPGTVLSSPVNVKLEEDAQDAHGEFVYPGHIPPLRLDPPLVSVVMCELVKITSAISGYQVEASSVNGARPSAADNSVPLFNEWELLQLRRQMSKHVQLLAQTYVQASYSKDTHLQEVAASSTQMLTELQQFARNSRLLKSSFFSTVNLDSAISVVSQPVSVDSEEERKTLDDVISKVFAKRFYISQGLSWNQMSLFATSAAFMYPQLIPYSRLVVDDASEKQRRVMFSDAEDNLLAMGVDQFGHLPGRYSLIRKFLLPTKTTNQLMFRFKNCKQTQSFRAGAVQHLVKYSELPDFPRQFEMDFINDAVAPINRARNWLPKWFTVYDEFKIAQKKEMARQVQEAAIRKQQQLNRGKRPPTVGALLRLKNAANGGDSDSQTGSSCGYYDDVEPCDASTTLSNVGGAVVGGGSSSSSTVSVGNILLPSSFASAAQNFVYTVPSAINAAPILSSLPEVTYVMAPAEAAEGPASYLQQQQQPLSQLVNFYVQQPVQQQAAYSFQSTDADGYNMVPVLQVANFNTPFTGDAGGAVYTSTPVQNAAFGGASFCIDAAQNSDSNNTCVNVTDTAAATADAAPYSGFNLSDTIYNMPYIASHHDDNDGGGVGSAPQNTASGDVCSKEISRIESGNNDDTVDYGAACTDATAVDSVTALPDNRLDDDGDEDDGKAMPQNHCSTADGDSPASPEDGQAVDCSRQTRQFEIAVDENRRQQLPETTDMSSSDSNVIPGPVGDRSNVAVIVTNLKTANSIVVSDSQLMSNRESRDVNVMASSVTDSSGGPVITLTAAQLKQLGISINMLALNTVCTSKVSPPSTSTSAAAGEDADANSGRRVDSTETNRRSHFRNEVGANNSLVDATPASSNRTVVKTERPSPDRGSMKTTSGDNELAETPVRFADASNAVCDDVELLRTSLQSDDGGSGSRRQKSRTDEYLIDICQPSPGLIGRAFASATGIPLNHLRFLDSDTDISDMELPADYACSPFKADLSTACRVRNENSPQRSVLGDRDKVTMPAAVSSAVSDSCTNNVVNSVAVTSSNASSSNSDNRASRRPDDNATKASSYAVGVFSSTPSAPLTFCSARNDDLATTTTTPSRPPSSSADDVPTTTTVSLVGSDSIIELSRALDDENNESASGMNLSGSVGFGDDGMRNASVSLSFPETSSSESVVASVGSSSSSLCSTSTVTMHLSHHHQLEPAASDRVEFSCSGSPCPTVTSSGFGSVETKCAVRAKCRQILPKPAHEQQNITSQSPPFLPKRTQRAKNRPRLSPGVVPIAPRPACYVRPVLLTAAAAGRVAATSSTVSTRTRHAAGPKVKQTTRSLKRIAGKLTRRTPVLSSRSLSTPIKILPKSSSVSPSGERMVVDGSNPVGSGSSSTGVQMSSAAADAVVCIGAAGPNNAAKSGSFSTRKPAGVVSTLGGGNLPSKPQVGEGQLTSGVVGPVTPCVDELANDMEYNDNDDDDVGGMPLQLDGETHERSADDVSGSKTKLSPEIQKTRRSQELTSVGSSSSMAQNESEGEIYAQLYLQRVFSKLSSDNKVHIYFSLLQLLNDFGLRPASDSSVTQLYKSVCQLLVDYPDLTHDFSSFLLPGQSIECNCFMDNVQFHNAVNYVHKLQAYISKLPSRQHRLQKTFKKWFDGHITNSQLKEFVVPLIRSNSQLTEEFLHYFSDEPPASSSYSLDDFEYVQLSDDTLSDDTFSSPLTDSDYELVDLSNIVDTDGYGTPSCPCVCHTLSVQASVGKSTTLRHCANCALKIIRGCLYFQTSDRFLRQATVVHHQRNVDSSGTSSSATTSDSCQAVVETVTVSSHQSSSAGDVDPLPGNQSPDASGDVLASVDAQKPRGREPPASPSTQRDDDCHVTWSSSPIDDDLQKAEGLCTTSDCETTTNVSSRPQMTPPSGRREDSSVTEDDDVRKLEDVGVQQQQSRSWTKDEDKIILEQVRDRGPNTDTFRRIVELVDNVTTDQVSERFEYLWSLFEASSEDDGDDDAVSSVD